jgi:hypothetical protein
MTDRKEAMPEPNRSEAELAFVLRNAKRRTGPAVLRDLARDTGEQQLQRVRPLRRPADDA